MIKIFTTIVKDDEFGDEVASAHEGQKTANKKATDLRKTFRKVEVRPLEVEPRKHGSEFDVD
jgi:hypothetical protein